MSPSYASPRRSMLVQSLLRLGPSNLAALDHASPEGG